MVEKCGTSKEVRGRWLHPFCVVDSVCWQGEGKNSVASVVKPVEEVDEHVIFCRIHAHVKCYHLKATFASVCDLIYNVGQYSRAWVSYGIKQGATQLYEESVAVALE